ncbi:Ku protein [Aquibium sp. ELW1220]|uniref:non-homologous end joining protein Ku n=1 Tax=Aquibium sp. ELW1220 TaxID=2976766 RepID=UPI0025B12162|nr:Ku protein [Aquibium sp. ELW1220]MDN2578502.1 Ku protein [Aquibium sp. ELW1220]
MASRAVWKGHLQVAELSCGVALHAAASTSERVSFNILNRKTGNRVQRQYVDEETEKPVERDDIVKGYELGSGQYVILEPDEIADAVPQADKTLRIEAFLTCPEIETVYFDKPYHVAPSDAVSESAFAVIREGMRAKNVAAIARTVLFRRVRTVLLRAQGPGLIANTLNFDYEVRSAQDAFTEVPDIGIKGEMLDLAKYIIETKKGEFHPSDYDDRYDAALAELVKAKMEGRALKPATPKPKAKVVDLMEALRRSAEASGKSKPAASAKTAATRAPPKTAPRKKAG